MKVVVIGCTHAGTASILNIAETYPEAEITVYERNDNISFLSCGIALHVGGVVEDPAGLFYSSPENLAKLGVTTRMQHDVLSVDVENKRLEAKNLLTGEIITDSFDKLVITTGSWPIMPEIQGNDLEGVLLCKNYDHAKVIVERAKDANKIAVVGAGYIGVELVEAFEHIGKEVTLIDTAKRCMSRYYDKEFTDIYEKAFTDKGITLAYGETVTKLEGEDGKVARIITDKAVHQTDLVIICIGFRPNTDLFKGQVEMIENGAIIVDEYMRTSKEDVFAAGDSCVVHYNPTGGYEYIPLATNAIRMGYLVGKNLKENKIKYLGTQSTSGIKIYNHNLAATGLTESEAIRRGFEVETSTITENHRPEFMPSYDSLTVKIVFDKKTRRILGGQVYSREHHVEAINTLSVVIQNKMKIEELAMVDFFFQPHFNNPWNHLNVAALNAL